ncbi:MAG: hypothetical protein A3F72_00105 [Bacteroidetes bacterium RIFCSPLOWO2_12_FULL_35_15]|nr:MAG: hypothetical protein A3F72_00105 [Bacteroidetes bacterium RIFCSPLOWO2_12_FULL_35_15]
MRRIIIFLFFVILHNFSFSQSFDWLTEGGGPLSDKATGIAIDAYGNTYITGFFNEEATFGSFYQPTIDPLSKEVFVAKIDPQGNYLWAKRGSNHYDDRGLGICLDPSGNVYVTGTCWGGLVFGSLSVYNSTFYTDQIFVLKLDTNGNEIWLKNAGVDESGYPYNDDQGFDLTSDSNGNIYVTGFLSNHDFTDLYANFDALQIIVPADDSLAFVAKLSNAGLWQWVRTFGGLDDARDNRITTDAENNIYVTGGFRGTQTFGTTILTSYGGSDVYVVKYDDQGNFIYAKNAGSPLDDRGNDIAFDHTNHLYITGEFKAKAIFGNDTINNNGSDDDRDIFVARMSKTGVFEWVKKAGSNNGGDRGNGIVVNNTGNIFVTGQYKDTAKFGGFIEVYTGPGDIQIFIAAIDSLGKWRWVLNGGSISDDRGNGITCDNDCNVFADGFYENTLNFYPSTINSAGLKDIFTVKVKEACFYYVAPPPVEPLSEFSASNVFSPNGDGVNDLFKFTTKNISKLNCQIYDRWGLLVYEIKNAEEGWAGRTKTGMNCSSGVYYYVVTAEGLEGKQYKEKGFIQLLR